MAQNRVVEGRMVTPMKLAELVEGEPVLETEQIDDADRSCPDCGGDVLVIGYMPSVTSYVTGWKCQSCPWQETETA